MSRISKDSAPSPSLDSKKASPSLGSITAPEPATPAPTVPPVEPEPAPSPVAQAPAPVKPASRTTPGTDDVFGDLLSPQDPSEHGLSQKAIRMKRHLDKQSRVPLLIPREKSDPVGATAFFGINSYKYYVKKGEVVQVPEQVAQMYYASIGAEDAVLRNHKLNLANQGSEASRHALNY